CPTRDLSRPAGAGARSSRGVPPTASLAQQPARRRVLLQASQRRLDRLGDRPHGGGRLDGAPSRPRGAPAVRRLETGVARMTREELWAKYQAGEPLSAIEEQDLAAGLRDDQDLRESCL